MRSLKITLDSSHMWPPWKYRQSTMEMGMVTMGARSSGPSLLIQLKGGHWRISIPILIPLSSSWGKKWNGMSYLDNFILKTGLSSWNLVFNWIRSTVISLVIRRNTLSKPFFNSHENFFCNKFLGLVENFLVNSSCRILKWQDMILDTWWNLVLAVSMDWQISSMGF